MFGHGARMCGPADSITEQLPAFHLTRDPASDECATKHDWFLYNIEERTLVRSSAADKMMRPGTTYVAMSRAGAEGAVHGMALKWAGAEFTKKRAAAQIYS